MGSSASPITALPPGYTIEQQSPAAMATLPSGYQIEQPKQAAPTQPQGPTIGPVAHASETPTFGEEWQTPQQRLTMPLVKGLMMLHEKLQEVENLTTAEKQRHPIQGAIGDLANRIEGLLIGTEHGEAAIGTGKYGMLTNPVTAGLMPGAGGEPAAAGVIRGGAELLGGLKGGAQEALALRGGGGAAPEYREIGKQLAKNAVPEEAPSESGLISKIKLAGREVIHGKGVQQEPAQAAVRGMVGAEKGTPILEGNKTAADDLLETIKGKERAAYKAQDEAAGFDVKETRAKLRDAEYKVKQPEVDDATRERLETKIGELKSNIADAEKKMKAAGVDSGAADKVFRQRKALEEFRKGLVQHTSADGESVNVDGLLNYAKKLRNSKYGDRLEQIAGKEGADKFMEQLQQAKEIGAHAVKVQKIAQWLAGLVGAGTVVEAGRRIISE